MFYDVWAVSDIPAEEKDFIADECGAMFRNTMLAGASCPKGLLRLLIYFHFAPGMAIPEVMETQSAVASTFVEIEAMATNGWRALQQLIRVVSLLHPFSIS